MQGYFQYFRGEIVPSQPRNLSVEENPSMTETKLLPVGTPVFGAQKRKNMILVRFFITF